MVQEYLNEIAPTMHGPNKLKTSGKPLRIADLQPPASGQDKPDTRENIGRHTYSVVLNFFVERPDFTKSLMATKKQLSIIVNKKQRT